MIYDRTQIDAALRVVIGSLLEAWASGPSLSLTQDGARVKTVLQAAFSLKHPDPLHRQLHEIVLTHVLRAEQLSPLGAACVMRCLREAFERSAGGSQLSFNENPFSACSSVTVGCPSRQDVEWLVRELTSSPLTREALLEALDLSGFNGSIIIEKSSSREASVEQVRGYSFRLSPGFPVRARFDRPRIVCIDGFIPSVAEVHHLLTAASESLEPVLVFHRGAADEVIHTLSVNYSRGSLRMVPIHVLFDLDGINTLADLCAVTGADLVSSSMGDLISQVDLAKAPCVERATVLSDRVLIQEEQAGPRTATQVRALRSKRQECTDDSLARLYDDRIRSLTPSYVTVRFPDDIEYVRRAQEADYVLRALRSLSSHGTVDLAGKKHLVASVMAGTACARRCLDLLGSLGASVIVPGSKEA